MDRSPDLIVYTDGASRKNPGPSSAGVVICDLQGRELHAFGLFLGEGTNNQAEYKAIVKGLTAAVDYSQGWVEVRSDSQVAVRQLNGEYETKDPTLEELQTHVRRAEGLFRKVTYAHVPREHLGARRADALANQALDHEAHRGSARAPP